MIDLHSHILPGVDDGADSLETSLRMLRHAQKDGIRAVVATPHCSRPGDAPNFLSPALIQDMELLCSEASRQGIHVRIYPGMEVFVTDTFQQRLREGKFLTLANSRYLLVEFYFDESPEFITGTLADICQAGLTPVLAHPERYYCVEWEPELVRGWMQGGCVIQVNRGSIQGKLGTDAQACAWELLKNEYVHVVASDAHGADYRRPELKDCLLELGDSLSWAYASKLMIENPACIIRNQAISTDLSLPD